MLSRKPNHGSTPMLLLLPLKSLRNRRRNSTRSLHQSLLRCMVAVVRTMLEVCPTMTTTSHQATMSCRGIELFELCFYILGWCYLCIFCGQEVKWIHRLHILERRWNFLGSGYGKWCFDDWVFMYKSYSTISRLKSRNFTRWHYKLSSETLCLYSILWVNTRTSSYDLLWDSWAHFNHSCDQSYNYLSRLFVCGEGKNGTLIDFGVKGQSLQYKAAKLRWVAQSITP